MNDPRPSISSQFQVAAHMPALDGLRAIAILMVIPHNVDLLSAPYSPVLFPLILVEHAGWIGVQLFFVLSGFLITGGLLDSQRSTNYYSSFFGRRALRIFPLYYSVLIFSFLVIPAFFSLPDGLQSTLHNQFWLWTFLLNWVQPFGLGVQGFSHFWSLAVEEQFYLLWPLLIRRRTPVQVIWLCTGITMAAITVRTYMMYEGTSPAVIYEFTVCRMDALALGGIAASLIRIPAVAAVMQDVSRRFYLYGIVMLLMTGVSTRLYSIDDPVCQTIGYTLLSLAFTLVVLAAGRKLPQPEINATNHRSISHLISRLLSKRFLSLIGQYSYAMYVFHLPLHLFIGAPLLMRTVDTISPSVAVVYTIALIGACFVAAAISYHALEKHFLRLKYRFTPNMVPPG